MLSTELCPTPQNPLAFISKKNEYISLCVIFSILTLFNQELVLTPLYI